MSPPKALWLKEISSLSPLSKIPLRKTSVKLTLENSEAVSQLLSVAPPREVGEENEWEEVIISDAHVLVKETLGIMVQQSLRRQVVKPEVSLGTTEMTVLD